MTRYTLLIVIALALQPVAAVAQEAPSIASGSRLRLWTSSGGEPVSGRILSLDGASITLMPDQESTPMVVSRASIVQVDVSRGRRSRGKSVLNGFLIGAGIGLVAGYLAGDDPKGFLSLTAEEKGLVAGTLLGATGAVFGLAFGPGQERWTPTTLTPPKLSLPAAGPAASLRFSFRF